jgi:[ribosomal protein S18]-alanine N-acetyltransferase
MDEMIARPWATQKQYAGISQLLPRTQPMPARIQTRVHIRWMIRRDMPEVLAIEDASFELPWDEERFLSHLRERATIGMVAELGERVVGYTIYELHPRKLQILNFCVDPEFRRQGIGQQLADKLIKKLCGDRRTSLVLTLRESNLSSQLFFRRAGFLAIDVIREHFGDTGEDGYVMRYDLDTDQENPL